MYTGHRPILWEFPTHLSCSCTLLLYHVFFYLIIFFSFIWRNSYKEIAKSMMPVIFNWSVVDLQCYVNFCYTTKYSAKHTHTHILFFIFFSLWFIPGHWILFLVLHSRTLLSIHSIHNTLLLLTPNSRFIPSLPSLLATTSLFSMSKSLLLLGR